MGGGYYERDYETSSTGTSSSSARAALSAQSIHADCMPLNRIIRCTHKNPIVIALDVSGSMSDWPRIIWDKLPVFYGQMMMQGYLEDPAIAFCAIDDLSDSATLQVTEFAQGGDIDAWLKKIWLESGGSGPDDGLPCEAYDVAAFFWAHRCRLENAQKPFLFICADEAPRLTTDPRYLKHLLGVDVEQITPKQIFANLRKKFNVFLLRKPYSGYDDKIIARWAELIGSERIMTFRDPKAVVDCMLGCIALVSGARSLDAYKVDMEARGQTTERLAEVGTAMAKCSFAHTADNPNE